MVEILQLPPRWRWILRGGPDVRVAAAQALNANLPEQAYGSMIRDPDDLFWLEPDAWLLQTDDPTFTRRLHDVLDDLHFALVDVSERFIGIAVRGPDAIAALQAGCPLDLHPRVFPTGRVTRTLLGKAEVILLRRDDAPTFELLTGRSFMPYLRQLLDDAALEHGSRAAVA